MDSSCHMLSAGHALCHVLWESREGLFQRWKVKLGWSRLAFSKGGRKGTLGRKGKPMIKAVETQEGRTMQ